MPHFTETRKNQVASEPKTQEAVLLDYFSPTGMHYQKAYLFVLKRINGADCSPQVAEEILQETYINLRRAVSGRVESPIFVLERFIFTSLYKACINFYRKRDRLTTESIDEYLELESGYGIPEQLYMEQLKSALIAAAIDKHVSQYEQLALRLRLYEGYTQEQIAEIFNATYPERIFTAELIKRYTYTGKQKLKKVLPAILADWYQNMDATDEQIAEDEEELVEEKTSEVAPLWQRVVHTDPMEDPIYALTWAQVQKNRHLSEAFYDALGKRMKAFFEGSQK